MDNKTFNELSIDSKMLYEALVKIRENETITYNTLSEIIGRDVQDSARGNLMTARKMALRNNGFVFSVIRNHGLQRLDDIGIVETSNIGIRKVRRASKVHAVLLSKVEFDNLDNEKRIQHNAALSVFGALYAMTKPNAVKRIESVVSETMKELPLSKTLEVFK